MGTNQFFVVENKIQDQMFISQHMIKSHGVENLRTARVRLKFGLGFGEMRRGYDVMFSVIGPVIKNVRK